jgi:hypothetical protein
MYLNGIPYDWANIRFMVSLLPSEIVDISSIEYSEAIEKEWNYGAGNSPVSRSIGNRSAEGKVTLGMAEVHKLTKLSPTGSIMDLPPFDIVVAYIPENEAFMKTDILKNVEFTSHPTTASQNDKNLQVELDLFIHRIERK